MAGLADDKEKFLRCRAIEANEAAVDVFEAAWCNDIGRQVFLAAEMSGILKDCMFKLALWRPGSFADKLCREEAWRVDKVRVIYESCPRASNPELCGFPGNIK